MTGGSQPAWSGPVFPIPGTQYTDNTVTWTCMGSDVKAGVAPVVTVPVDSDPPVSGPFVLGQQTLANFVAFLQAYAGLTIQANTWQGPQNFQGFAGDSNAAELFFAAPTIRKLAAQYKLSGGYYARIYQDVVLPGATDDSVGVGLTITVGAAWNGTDWILDTPGQDAAKLVIGASSFGLYIAPGASSFADSAWVQQLGLPMSAAGAPALNVEVPIAGTNLGLSGQVTVLKGVPTSGSYGVPGVIESAGPISCNLLGSLLVQTPASGPVFTNPALVRITVAEFGSGTPTLTINTGDDGTVTGVPMTLLGTGTAYNHHSFIGTYRKLANQQIAVSGVPGVSSTMSATIELLA